MSRLENLRQIPRGRAGTSATISQMQSMVNTGKKKKVIIDKARSIIYNVPERDHRGEVNKIFKWVKQNVRFVNDVYAVETLQQPWHLVQEPKPSGDCDDLSTTLNTLLSAVGYDTAFKTIKADSRMPNEFSHVYSLVQIDGRWIPLDPSQKMRPLGWEPPQGKNPALSQVWGHAKGMNGKSVPQNNNVKGTGMAGLEMNPIKTWAMGLFKRNRRQQLPPQNQEHIIVEQKRPHIESDPEGKMTNLYPDVEFDPDDHNYYGDWGGENAGQYTIQRKELLTEPGEALNFLWPSPEVRPWDYGEYHHMDKKFGGKRTKRRVLEDSHNAVTDGTPEVL